MNQKNGVFFANWPEAQKQNLEFTGLTRKILSAWYLRLSKSSHAQNNQNGVIQKSGQDLGSRTQTRCVSLRPKACRFPGDVRRGSTIRPTRQRYSLSLLDQTLIGQKMMGQTTEAPALTARAKAASGSPTTITIRTVVPPRNSAPSDSGIKFLCSGERGPHTARFSPDGVQTHPRPKIPIPPRIAGRPPLELDRIRPRFEPRASGK